MSAACWRRAAAAATAAAHEARQSFGDGAVYRERRVEGGRHIEVQLLGDEGGEIMVLTGVGEFRVSQLKKLVNGSRLVPAAS